MTGAPDVAEAVTEVGPLHSPFHVVTVACARFQQIRDGSKPRLDAGDHKDCTTAVAEVRAGSVPCYRVSALELE